MTDESKATVDWLSWTDEPICRELSTVGEALDTARRRTRIRYGDFFVVTTVVEPRRPYTLALSSDYNARVYFSQSPEQRALYELSGRACQRLQEYGDQDIRRLLDTVTATVTRIDIAVDIHTDTRPYDFAIMRDNDRFRTGGHFTSDSGETFYVGSRKSRRYARVYRYDPPHPRDHLLRIEMVFRKEAARLAAAEIVDNGVEAAAAAAGEVFGWRHPVWTRRSDKPIPRYRPERKRSNTIRWLYTQVAPAVQKLIDEQVLTWGEIAAILRGEQ